MFICFSKCQLKSFLFSHSSWQRSHRPWHWTMSVRIPYVNKFLVIQHFLISELTKGLYFLRTWLVFMIVSQTNKIESGRSAQYQMSPRHLRTFRAVIIHHESVLIVHVFEVISENQFFSSSFDRYVLCLKIFPLDCSNFFFDKYQEAMVSLKFVLDWDRVTTSNVLSLSSFHRLVYFSIYCTFMCFIDCNDTRSIGLTTTWQKDGVLASIICH